MKSKLLSSLHFIDLYTLISPHNHLCGVHSFANFEVVSQLRHEIVMRLEKKVKVHRSLDFTGQHMVISSKMILPFGNMMNV